MYISFDSSTSLLGNLFLQDNSTGAQIYMYMEFTAVLLIKVKKLEMT